MLWSIILFKMKFMNLDIQINKISDFCPHMLLQLLLKLIQMDMYFPFQYNCGNEQIWLIRNSIRKKEIKAQHNTCLKYVYK